MIEMPGFSDPPFSGSILSPMMLNTYALCVCVCVCVLIALPTIEILLIGPVCLSCKNYQQSQEK